MVRPGSERVIAALDVGSSKVCALIALFSPEGETRVLGSGQRACQGVKRGYVADMEKTELAIRQAVDQAERNAQVNADSAFVSFSAGGLDSDIASVDVDIAGHRIEQADIDLVLSEGKRSLDPGNRTVLHAQPALYTLDGLQGVMNPLGFHANRLGVDIHVITADTPPIRNLDLSVRQAHMGVDKIVAAPVASGLSCLAAEERELGVALVELGAGVTNVAVFARGMLVGLSSIPMGAADITDDIAAAFSTRREHAERLKCFYGSATNSPRDNHEMIEIMPLSEDDGAEPGRVTRSQLISVIRQRLDLLLGDIGARLNDMGFTGPGGRQLVLCGGGAELKGIADFAQGVLGRSVRVGRPRGLVGLPEAQSTAAFSTLAGLALFAGSDNVDITSIGMQENAAPRSLGNALLGKLIQVFRSNP